MRTALVGLPFGLAFGALLSWGGLSDPAVVEDMLMLRSFDVFMLMGAAMVVAAVGARVLRRLGARTLLDSAPIAWVGTAPTRAHVAGSALFGVGWAMALTCPGPIAAQIGSGNVAGMATGAGVLGGVALAGWWKERASATPRASAAEAPPIGL